MTNLNDHRKLILTMAQKGKTVEEIADHFKVDRETMLDWFRAEMLSGTVAPFKPSKFEIEKRAAAIRERRAKGMTHQAIADDIGMSMVGMLAWCKKHKIKLPPVKKSDRRKQP